MAYKYVQVICHFRQIYSPSFIILCVAFVIVSSQVTWFIVPCEEEEGEGKEEEEENGGGRRGRRRRKRRQGIFLAGNMCPVGGAKAKLVS